MHSRLALTLPLRSERLFVRKTLAAAQELGKLWEGLSGSNRDLEWELKSLFTSLTGDDRAWFNLSHVDLTEFKRRLQDLKRLPDSRFEGWLGFYVNDLSSIQELVVKHARSLSRVTSRSVTEALEDLGLEWDAEYEEGLPPAMQALPVRLAEAFAKTQKVLAIQLARYDASQANRNDDTKLNPGSVEVLYHASANAKGLYSSGFSRSVPDESQGMGLGGSQTDKSGNRAISTTYDLQAALGITRVYKELALVYQGKVKPTQILDWVRREGKPQDFLRFLATEWKDSNITFKFEKGSWSLDQPEATPQGYRRKALDINQTFAGPKFRIKLYKAYLSTTPNRFNPFFMHIQTTAKYLARNAGGIGVLALEVDMTHPDILFLSGEREYRVPPEAVIRIKKLLRYVKCSTGTRTTQKRRPP